MKNSLLCATLVAVAPAFHFGAREAAAQRGGEVAIIDLTYIFANHTRFKAMTEDMKQEVEAAEDDLKGQKEFLRKMADRLEEYKRGTQEYKQLEEEFVKKQAELTSQVNIQKNNFLEQEARNYYQVYQEVLEHVKDHADRNGINLVLRFNGDPIDQTDPREVIKELNKSVVYYNRAIDITPVILDEVNGGAPPPRQAAPKGADRRSRPGVPRRSNK